MVGWDQTEKGSNKANKRTRVTGIAINRNSH